MCIYVQSEFDYVISKTFLLMLLLPEPFTYSCYDIRSESYRFGWCKTMKVSDTKGNYYQSWGFCDESKIMTKKSQILEVETTVAPDEDCNIKTGLSKICTKYIPHKPSRYQVIYTSENDKVRTNSIQDRCHQWSTRPDLQSCQWRTLFLISFARFEKWGWTDGRTDMCKNNDHYWPWLWVGRVDQLMTQLKKINATNWTFQTMFRSVCNSMFVRPS